jgi:hypothetical protein
MEGIKEALSSKIMGLPGWVWLLIGVGLFFVFSRSKSSESPSAGYSFDTTPTSDQMTGNAVNDLKNSMQSQIDDRFGEITEQNADAMAGTQQQLTDFMGAQAVWFQQLMDSEKDDQDSLIGAVNSNNANYMTALATSNQQFLDALHGMMQSFGGNGVAPTQGNRTDPTAGLPQWAKDRLNSEYWASKKYLRRDETNLGSQYSAALNDLLRSDTSSGLNVAGASQAAFDQINSLIASGQVVQNPLYKG